MMMGPSAFKLLKRLVSPAKPGDKTYVELVEGMKQYRNLILSEIVQRYKSNSPFWQECESIAQVLSELRALAEHCNYGASFDDMLWDPWQVKVEETGLVWRQHIDQIWRRYSDVPCIICNGWC